MSLVISKVFTYDTDAGNYIQAVEGPAGDNQALEPAVRQAINNFVVGCKQDGIWNAIKASCILAGARTLSGALVPLVGTAPNKYGTEGNWNYNRKTGLQGDGSTNYLDSNRNNTIDPQDNKHLSLYLTAISGASITFYHAQALGIASNTLGDAAAGGRYSLNGASTSNAPGLPTANSLLGVNRASSASMDLRLNHKTLTYSLTSAVPAGGSITFQARRSVSTGSPEAFRNDRLAFYSIGESLDLARLDSRVTDLIAAFNNPLVIP